MPPYNHHSPKYDKQYSLPPTSLWNMGHCTYYNHQTPTRFSHPYHRNMQTNGNSITNSHKIPYSYYPKQTKTRNEAISNATPLN